MVITLLTDFGLNGPYVASMKGVILGIYPEVSIVDISHEICPQNIEEAAFILYHAYSYFPPGSIHVVVVDPGVGKDRAILTVQTENFIFLAPDNGVLKYIYRDNPEAQVYRVTDSSYFLKKVSATFHGRDIFAPVAAHLSRGVKPDSLGDLADCFIKGSVPEPAIKDQKISGEIVYFDRFGNGITNITGELLQELNISAIKVRSSTIRSLSRAYMDVPVKEPLALIGSCNTLEISVNQGNAKDHMGLHTGDSVQVLFTTG